MSSKGIHTALSGALAQSQKLDTIANNLANVNTPGFKSDQQTFRAYLTDQQKPENGANVPRTPATIESFYHQQGTDQTYVDSDGTITNFDQGSLKKTGNALDLAIDGGGFFEVATPAGVRMTRAGAFKIDGNGQIVTKDGFPVLRSAAAGTDPAERVLRVNMEQALSITDRGEVFQGEEAIGSFSIVNVDDVKTLNKEGGALWGFKSNATNTQPVPVGNPSVKQGFLEMSNVNIVKEMTDMIATTRVFESTQKAISAYDSMSDKLINQVGSSR